MKGRQTLPREWLIVDAQPNEKLWRSIRRLPLGSGIFVVGDLSASERRRLRLLAATRDFTIAEEARGDAVRVHNLRELRRALIRRTPLILLSPIYPTDSHPDWEPLARTRAAALARLAGRNLVALGGMDARRYAKVARFGFSGWAGISAFRT